MPPSVARSIRTEEFLTGNSRWLHSSQCGRFSVRMLHKYNEAKIDRYPVTVCFILSNLILKPLVEPLWF
jgi:hypothetical protein